MARLAALALCLCLTTSAHAAIIVGRKVDAIDHSFKGKVTLHGATARRDGAKLVHQAVKLGMDASMKRAFDGDIVVRVQGDAARRFVDDARDHIMAPSHGVQIVKSEAIAVEGGNFRTVTKLSGVGADITAINLMNEAKARGLKGTMRKNPFTGNVTIRTSGSGARSFAHAVPGIIEQNPPH